MGKASLETAIREEYLSTVAAFLEQKMDADVLRVSTNELAMPVVDAEGNERFVVIKISTPRGTRNGSGSYTPYDGYALAEDYRLDCEEKDAKKAARRAEAEAEEKRKAQKREDKKKAAEAKKALAELKKVVHDIKDNNEAE